MGYIQTQNDTNLFTDRVGCPVSALVYSGAYVSGSACSHNHPNRHSCIRYLLRMVVHSEPTEADINFQGKHADEQLQFYFHQHWIRMLWPLTKLILVNALVLSIGYVLFRVLTIEDDAARRLLLTLFTAFFLITNFEFLVRFYRYLLYVIVVTDKKIHRIKKSLFMLDDHQSMDLWMLQDIFKCQHGIIQNILRFGTLILEAQETIIRIHFAPSVSEKYEKLMHLREQARSKMGYIGGILKRT